MWGLFYVYFVIIILLLEQFSRGKGKLSQARAVADRGIKKKADGFMRTLFFVTVSIYLFFTLAIPFIQLLNWSLVAKDTVVFRNFDSVMFNTLLIVFVVTFFVVVSGIIIGNMNRLHSSIISKIYARIVILGYSVPASIIAIAILVFFISIDRSLSGIYQIAGLKKLFLTGSVFMLMFALVIRFMAIGFNNIEAGMSKIGKKYYEASKLLGKGEWNTFRLIDFPMLKPSIISASILTFVDVLKELLLTLILRPFNFDTLATRVYTYAGDEMIHEASVYSLMIIGVSIIALISLSRLRKEKI